MRGFKAFETGLYCRGKVYSENTVFNESRAVPNEIGMHFCKRILDVLDYYSLIGDNGDIVEIAEVEAIGKVGTADNKSFCTTKLKVLEKVSLLDLIEIGMGELKRDCSRLALDEDYAKLVSRDVFAKLASSGYNAKVVTSGEYSQIATSGNYSQIVALGNYTSIATSGDYSKVIVGGEYSCITSSGYGSRIWVEESGSQVATSGDCCSISVRGENSIVSAIGINSIVRGIKGTMITLAEYEETEDAYIPKGVKSAQIDGTCLKAGTWYCLKGGEFREVEYR